MQKRLNSDDIRRGWNIPDVTCVFISTEGGCLGHVLILREITLNVNLKMLHRVESYVE